MSKSLLIGLWFCLFTTDSQGHLPNYVSTPPSKIEQHCLQAESCVHDTIPVCGKMEEEKRTFLDICDLLEYVCDHNKLVVHVDDVPGCPLIKERY